MYDSDETPEETQLIDEVLTVVVVEGALRELADRGLITIDGGAGASRPFLSVTADISLWPPWAAERCVSDEDRSEQERQIALWKRVAERDQGAYRGLASWIGTQDRGVLHRLLRPDRHPWQQEAREGHR